MMTSDPLELYVLVVCPLCHTRMHPRRERIGQQIKCPDCGTVSPILPPPQAPTLRDRETPGEYDLRSPEAFGDPTATSVTPRHPANEPAGNVEATTPRQPPRRPPPPALALVKCPLCHTRMHPPAADRGNRIRCPDCGTEVLVPAAARAPVRKPPPALVRGQYDMGQAPRVPEPQVAGHLLAQAVPESLPPPPPPRWTMFSGVFTFPFQRESISRWLYLTIGLLLCCQIGVFATGGMADGSFGGIAAAAALGGVILILLIWTDSFAAACLLAVVRETAAGNDVVEQWPESDWREWIWPLLYVLQVALVASGVAYLDYKGLELAGADRVAAALAGAAVTAVLFPVLLLSVLENDSPLALLSKPVLRSLVRLPHYWLLFHLETLLPLAGILAIGWLSLPGWMFYAGLIVPPLLAAQMLIYARLLGRMAWHIGEMEERRQAAEVEIE